MPERILDPSGRLQGFVRHDDFDLQWCTKGVGSLMITLRSAYAFVEALVAVLPSLAGW